MRAISFILATIVGFTSQYALADIVRRASIPGSLWGTWAASTDECGKAGTSSITLSAKNYGSPKESCSVEWVDETPGAKAPNYSVHLKCAGSGAQSIEAFSNVILRQIETDQLSTGADFNSLKVLQRCLTDPRR